MPPPMSTWATNQCRPWEDEKRRLPVTGQALQRQPNDPETLNKSRQHSVRNWTVRIIAAYRQALEANPRYSRLVTISAAHLDRRNAEEAAACFQAGARTSAGRSGCHAQPRPCVAAQGQPARGNRELPGAIRRKPDFAEARFNLAIGHLLLGQFREGGREYAWHWRRTGSPGRSCPAHQPGTVPTWEAGPCSCAPSRVWATSFFPALRRATRQRGAGRPVYRSSPKIVSLLSRVLVFDRLAEPGRGSGAQRLRALVGDLPRLLDHARLDQIPAPLGLTSLPTQLAAMRTRSPRSVPPPHIGVTWRAGIKGQDPGCSGRKPIGAPGPDPERTPSNGAGSRSGIRKKARSRHSPPHLGRPAHDVSALNDQSRTDADTAGAHRRIRRRLQHQHAPAGRGEGKTAKVLVPTPRGVALMAEGKSRRGSRALRCTGRGMTAVADAFAQLSRDLSVSRCAKAGLFYWYTND